ncbi:nucleolin-like [Betta splendens]|uniref:Nucleolin-like n=1 Tax=Betta splendens TaxID=158456 RepID=A0A9W2Y8B6_BETSP|nr:nucleolin-like [Betta splendens]
MLACLTPCSLACLPASLPACLPALRSLFMAAARFTAAQVLEQIFLSQSNDDSEPEEESEEDVSSEEEKEKGEAEEADTAGPETDEGQKDSEGCDLRLDTSDEEVDDEEYNDDDDDDDDDVDDEDDDEIIENVQRLEQIELEDEDEEEEKEEEEDKTFISKDGKIKWSSAVFRNGEEARNVPLSPLSAQGPTEYAAAQAVDFESTFRMFVTPAVERIVLENTNLEGSRKLGSAWKGMDEVDLRAYLGLLILSGVYRSRGEAVASLWDAESGRAIFRATMSLKVFHAYSKLLRFDDRQTRPARRATDKLAAVREVWDAWVERLPSLYDPGPNVTVDEQLVPFRGRCSFRQYMPSKPAKYGLKFWVACDAKSSYAWKMQLYTGKPGGGGGGGEKRASEKKQGQRVVLDVTEGLRGSS